MKTNIAAVPHENIPDLVSCAAATRFLEFYQSALEFDQGRLALFVLPDRLSFTSNDIQKLAQYAAKQAQVGKDVYFHIHLHDLPDGASLSRGRITTAKAAIGLFADIDARGPCRKKPPETLCPDLGATAWLVEEFQRQYVPLRVSALVASGHGYYPVLWLKEPLIIGGDSDRACLESLGRRFHAALHGIATEHGWSGAVDYCDLAKVLRLPGCINWKDPSNPKPVDLVTENPTRFNPSDLEEILPEVESSRLVFPISSPSATNAGGQLALNPAAEVPSVLLTALAENHTLFTATWNNRRDDLKDQSASGYDMALAGIGVSGELTDQQIADLIIHHRRDFPGRKQDRRGPGYLTYLGRAISIARQGRQSSESAERQWEELAEAIKRPAITVDGGEEGTLSNATSHGRSVEDIGTDSVEVAIGSSAAEAEQPNRAVASTGVPPTQDGGVGPGCASALQFLVARVRKSGDVTVVYDNITLLAALPEAQLAVAYQQLRNALGTKLNGHHFSRAIKETRAGLHCKPAQKQTQDPRPVIRTDGRLLDEIAADAIAALEKANDPPVVFRRGGGLVLIHPDEEDRPVIMRATAPMMRGRLARVARFLKETKQGPIKVSPPEDLTFDVLSAYEGVFPPLGVVTQIPILRPDGTLRLETGYDPITRAFYHTSPSFKLGTITDTPDRAATDAAAKFLDEAIGEFPFETSADKANCIALMLTPILKVAFRMKAPLALIDAPKWGTGKSLLATVVYVLATGSEGAVCAAPTSEEEWRKRMTSILERGSAVVIIDNVNQTLQSPSLSAVLTTSNWEDRILGKSEDVRLPNVSTWIATGNNLALGGEMARRGYRIRLDAKVSNPSRRTGFKRNDQELLDWVAAHRGELVTALLTIIRAWWAAGKPKGNVPPFGSFNMWARIAGGILGHAAVGGFLENLDAVQQESDEESQQWEEFLRALARVFRRSAFTTAEVVNHAVHDRDLLSSSIPDEIGHPDESSNIGTSLQKRLGKALARKCGTRFGELELRLERCEPEAHTKVQRWRVEGDLDSLLSNGAN